MSLTNFTPTADMTRVDDHQIATGETVTISASLANSLLTTLLLTRVSLGHDDPRRERLQREYERLDRLTPSCS